MAKLALRELEQQDIIRLHSTLVEKSNGLVAQSEHTVLILEGGEIIITTKEE